MLQRGSSMVATHFDMLQRRAARCNTQHRRSRASATTVRRASGHRLELTLASAPHHVSSLQPHGSLCSVRSNNFGCMHAHGRWKGPCVCRHNDSGFTLATYAPGLGSPPAHICTRTGLSATTSAPGLGSALCRLCRRSDLSAGWNDQVQGRRNRCGRHAVATCALGPASRRRRRWRGT